MKTKFLKHDNLYSFDGKYYKYKSITPLSSKRYIVANNEYKYGLIDDKENIIIPCQYYYGFGGFGNLLFFENEYLNSDGCGCYDIGHLYSLDGKLLDQCKIGEKKEDYHKLGSIIRVINNEKKLEDILVGLYNTKGKKIADIKYNRIYRIYDYSNSEEFYIGWIEQRDNNDKEYYDYIDKNGAVNTFCVSTKQKYQNNLSKLRQCKFYKDYVVATFDDGYDYTDKGKYCERKYHRPHKKYIIDSEGMFTEISDYKISSEGIEYLM